MKGTGPRSGRREPAFPLSAEYVASAKRFANQELRLDWRKLASMEPPMWPGSLYLWDPARVAEENARLGTFHEQAAHYYFVGNNIAGIVFALDGNGRVVIFDEMEAGDPSCGIILAPTFEALLATVVRDDT